MDPFHSIYQSSLGIARLSKNAMDGKASRRASRMVGQYIHEMGGTDLIY